MSTIVTSEPYVPITTPMYGFSSANISSTQTIFYFPTSTSNNWICPPGGAHVVGFCAAIQTASTSGTITVSLYNASTSTQITSTNVAFTMTGTNTGNLFGYSVDPTAATALTAGQIYRIAAFFSGGAASVQGWLMVRYP